jgi:prepilin-type N-terminal cleavage/methylation domain-containing protein
MARPALNSRGFTLVELLVALMISGLLIGVIFQIMEGQGRYVSIQSAREEVQQNTRAAVELIGSELRTTPTGNGIEMASADSIRFRSARFWMLVCVGTNNGNNATVRMPKLDGASMGLNGGTRFVANVSSDPALPEWTNPVNVTGIGAPLANPPASCLMGDETVLPSQVEVRILNFASRPTGPVSLEQIVPGDAGYIYDQVTYRTGPSSTGGDWIQRRLGSASGAQNQPLAGPINPGHGLKFNYFSGDDELLAPIPDAATRATVDRLMMVVETTSRIRQGSVRQTRADTVVISLLNRIP